MTSERHNVFREPSFCYANEDVILLSINKTTRQSSKRREKVE